MARALVSVAAGKRGTSLSSENFAETRYEYDPFSYQRRPSHTIDVNGLKLGGEEVVRVVVRQTTYDKLAHKLDRLGDYQPEIIYENAGLREVDPRNHDEIKALNCETCDLLVTVRDKPRSSCYRGFPDAGRTTRAAPLILLKDTLAPTASDFLTILLTAATNIGALLSDGIGDAILVQGDMMSEGNLQHIALGPGQSLRLAYNILLAAGQEPRPTTSLVQAGGRTLFDLQTTTARIKAATSHLKARSPSWVYREWAREMADVNFGYVGGAPGKVNLRREDSREI